MKHRARAFGTAALAALTLLGAVGCAPAATSEPAEQLPGAVGRPALDVLAELPVKGRAPQTGYDRDRFGPQWADVDRNGCDTRNDVLARDLTGEVFRPGSDCVVVSGILADPYTGTTIDFVKAEGSSVDIDHVVALSNGWQTGAFGWDEARRGAFANDPLNLLAVDDSANRQKGDGDAATWLPPARDARCGYVARQVAVKAAYGLWVTAAERDAMVRILDGCPAERVPAAAPPPPAPQAVPFANCAAARSAGAAPLHRGDPGWSDAMDGDGDGVACE
ncbi:GmrSD restriction endonuclease domain-containing protein [Modestobacter lapidis]